MKVAIARWAKGLTTSARRIVAMVFTRDTANKCQVVSAFYCPQGRGDSIFLVSAASIKAVVK